MSDKIQNDRVMKNPALKATNIEGGYGSVQIINDINLTLGNNEIVTILGPNGSGKSTFIKILFGLATQYGGDIFHFDEAIEKLRTDELVQRGISYVPQVDNIFQELTIQENLEMGAYLTKDPISEDLNRVFSIFPELEERRYELASNLSGGQRQMLALSRALMTRPKLLLLDEPTAALSPLYVQQIIKKIVDLRDEGISILLVEQNAKSALSISDYCYVLANGRVVYHDDAEVILTEKDLGKLFLGEKTN